MQRDFCERKIEEYSRKENSFEMKCMARINHAKNIVERLENNLRTLDRTDENNAEKEDLIVDMWLTGYSIPRYLIWTKNRITDNNLWLAIRAHKKYVLQGFLEKARKYKRLRIIYERKLAEIAQKEWEAFEKMLDEEEDQRRMRVQAVFGRPNGNPIFGRPVENPIIIDSDGEIWEKDETSLSNMWRH